MFPKKGLQERLEKGYKKLKVDLCEYSIADAISKSEAAISDNPAMKIKFRSGFNSEVRKSSINY